jgi:hypothetical protein
MQYVHGRLAADLDEERPRAAQEQPAHQLTMAVFQGLQLLLLLLLLLN